MTLKLRRFLASKEFTEGAKKHVAEAVLKADTAGLPRAYDSSSAQKSTMGENLLIPRFKKKSN